MLYLKSLDKNRTNCAEWYRNISGKLYMLCIFNTLNTRSAFDYFHIQESGEANQANVLEKLPLMNSYQHILHSQL